MSSTQQVVYEFLSGSNGKIAVVVAAAITTYFLINNSRNKKNDKETLKLLTTSEIVPENMANCNKLLFDLPILDSENDCAEQLRSYLRTQCLKYSILVSDPEYLLKVTKFVGDKEMNGALLTRFTVQYNLFAGSIVAMGNDAQRQRLYDTQEDGTLGCFAFTECGAGVLSGAVVETTAKYNPSTKKFTIHSPNETSKKKWISQGVYAEYAVICANLIIDDGNGATKNSGPHLFFSRIQTRNNKGEMTSLPGVKIESLNKKTALLGLDNAFITFDNFEVEHADLLDRFSSVDYNTGDYKLHLPKGVNRMLDLLISRLLTGRICLSEATTNYGLALFRKSWDFASHRELWKGKKPKGKLISELPLMEAAFVDYSRSLRMVAYYIEVSRGRVAKCIQEDIFTYDTVEAACISKFVGTSFAVDTISVLRKLLGSQALYAESFLGASSFVGNATCAAEGDNTIMELKIVQDMFRGRTALFPMGLLSRCMAYSQGRQLVWHYCTKIGYAMMIREQALNDGQLLKDIAWCRAHMLILDTWNRKPRETTGVHTSSNKWLNSYESVFLRFPMPVQC